MNLMKKTALGFTLIELLVTISILSILSTIGFIIYSGVLPKTRDSKRISDLNKLATALEIYYQKNGRYMDGTPDSEGGCTSADTGAFYGIITSYITDLGVPKDPKKDPRTQTYPFYCYVSVLNGKSFRLFAKLEDCQASGGNLCNSPSSEYNYSVYSNDLTLSPPSAAPLPTPSPSPLP